MLYTMVIISSDADLGSSVWFLSVM